MNPAAFEVSRFLYLYRLVGVTLFELFRQRWLLLVFPNTFEYFFIAYEAVRTRWNPRRSRHCTGRDGRRDLGLHQAAPGVVDPHRPTGLHRLHGRPPVHVGRPRSPSMIAAIVIWTQRKRIPQPDWPFTVSVDRHLPPIEVKLTAQDKFFTAVLLEKVVLTR